MLSSFFKSSGTSFFSVTAGAFSTGAFSAVEGFLSAGAFSTAVAGFSACFFLP